MDIKNKKNLNDNYSGLRQIWAVAMNYIVAMPLRPASENINIENIIALNPDLETNIFKVEFIDETAGWKETPAESELGDVYKQSVECLVAKDYLQRNEAFAQLRNKRFLLFIFDANRVGHNIGHVDIDGDKNGAKCKVEHDSGSRRNDINALKISFYCESALPSAVLSPESNFVVKLFRICELNLKKWDFLNA